MRTEVRPAGWFEEALDGGAKGAAVKGSRLWQRRFVRAAFALLAAIASFLTVYAASRACGIDAHPAIVAAILAIVLARRPSPASAGHVAASFAALAGVAVAAGGVAWLLHTQLVLGAIVFTAVLALSVWLRNFGGLARRAGALIALPFISLLIVPPPTVTTRNGRITDLLLTAAGGMIALTFVTLAQWTMRRTGFAGAAECDGVNAPARPTRAAEPGARRGFSAQTRMAFQLAVALGAAFALGLLLFPTHWGWCVLTAFIVCSGARGRGDAAYKGVLRLGGALTGTAVAALVAHLWIPTGPCEAVLVFAILYAGMALRDANYAYWAGCMTLVLAILAGGDAGSNGALLVARLEAIVVGAVCAVAAAWYVMPIRAADIVRLRLATALVALDELVALDDVTSVEHGRLRAGFEYRMDELELVAPPLVWHHRLFVRNDAPHHPARWIALSRDVRDASRSIDPARRESAAARGALRRAIGMSRRAIGNHGKPQTDPPTPTVSDALERVRALMRPSGD